MMNEYRIKIGMENYSTYTYYTGYPDVNDGEKFCTSDYNQACVMTKKTADETAKYLNAQFANDPELYLLDAVVIGGNNDYNNDYPF